MTEAHTIYNNTSAFGLMPDHLRDELQAHHAAGGELEWYGPEGWQPSRPFWIHNIIYRAVKSAPTPDVIAWDRLPAWAKWVARDSDGRVFAYNRVPGLGSSIWKLGDGECRRIDDFPGFVQIGTVDWTDSLQQRPEGV